MADGSAADSPLSPNASRSSPPPPPLPLPPLPPPPAAAAAPPPVERWRRDDVRVLTTTALTTTGGTVWRAARAALDYFEAAAGGIGLARPGVRILELGAGCGWLGMTLARNLPNAGEVCVTEMAFGGALAHLRANVAANAAAGLPNIGVVTAAELDWLQLRNRAMAAAAARDGGGGAEEDGGEAATSGAGAQQQQGGDGQQQREQQQQQPPPRSYECSDGAGDGADLARLLASRWDFVVGSDLVYNEAGTRWLPHVMRALALAGRPARRQRQGQQERQHSNAGAAGGTAAAAAAGGRPGTAAADAAAIYYAHTKHRYDICDVEFLEECAAAGLLVEEVAPPGAPPRPPSPPPLSELFPEQRVAIFRITVLE